MLTTPESQENLTNFMQSFVNECGVYSVSARPRNILMWSHYACGHTGLCLQFEHKVGLFPGRSCKAANNVTYSRQFTLVSEMADPREHVERSILTKSHGWEYEREWRFIDSEDGPGYRSFDARFLSGVIFGAQMSMDDKKACPRVDFPRDHKPAAVPGKDQAPGIRFDNLTAGLGSEAPSTYVVPWRQ